MTSVVVPGPLADRLEPMLGCRLRTAEAAQGGHSKLVFICALEDGRRVIVKAATSSWKRGDVERESAILGVLADESLPVPRLIAAQSDDEWAIMITEFIDGRQGLSVLTELAHNPTLPAAIGTLTARILRSVHSTLPRPLAGSSFDRSHQVSALVGPLQVSGAPTDVVNALLPALEHPLHQRGVAFVHGDPGLHNLLWSPDVGAMRVGALGVEALGVEALGVEALGVGALGVAAVVDWEMAGWGNPLSDVAWVWWTFWFRGLPPATADAFAREYGLWAFGAMGWSPDSVDAAVRAQMAALLVRTEPGSAVRTVWIERIRSLTLLPDLPMPEG